MKKIIALFLLPLLVVSFNSCKDKEEEEKPKKLVKTLEWCENAPYADRYLATLHYDNQNRVIKAEVSFDTVTFLKINLEYSTNVVNAAWWTLDGDRITNYLLQLNNSGYLMSEITTDAPYRTCTYAYENGYVKESIFSLYPESPIEYFWMNGNIVQKSNSRVSATYEYDSRENLLNVDINDFDAEVFPDMHPRGLKLKGFASKNYLVKSTYTSGQNSTDILTFDYKFDKDGYPTEIICSYYSNGVKHGEVLYIITYY
jgi:hypothetical protein